MAPLNNEHINELLKSIKPGRTFTIEELVRKFGESRGEEWSGAFEVEAVAYIEQYLKENNLIKESGTTKVYTKV